MFFRRNGKGIVPWVRKGNGTRIIRIGLLAPKHLAHDLRYEFQIDTGN